MYHILAMLTELFRNLMHNQAATKAVILFTRFPVPGKTKTRLIGTLGAQGAADLQKHMTQQILSQIQPALNRHKIQLLLYFYAGSHTQMTQWLGHRFTYYRQKGDNLGQRMEQAFNQTGQQGAEQILLIGSDCPKIDEKVIRSGFTALQDHQLTLGPTADGGYYLIGLKLPNKQPAPEPLFRKISWGSDKVLQQTVQRAKAARISCQLLSQLHDIDRPEDLVYLDHHTCS